MANRHQKIRNKRALRINKRLKSTSTQTNDIMISQSTQTDNNICERVLSQTISYNGELTMCNDVTVSSLNICDVDNGVSKSLTTVQKLPHIMKLSEDDIKNNKIIYAFNKKNKHKHPVKKLQYASYCDNNKYRRNKLLSLITDDICKIIMLKPGGVCGFNISIYDSECNVVMRFEYIKQKMRIYADNKRHAINIPHSLEIPIMISVNGNLYSLMVGGLSIFRNTKMNHIKYVKCINGFNFFIKKN